MATVTASATGEPVKFAQQALMATFRGKPTEQMTWSVILGGIAYASATFSFGATLILGLLFTVTFVIGLTRFLYQSISGRM